MELKINFKLNWRYAIGEVVLIFIGITLAIWFENYKENIKTRQTELVLLKELLKDEERNENDLKLNLAHYIRAKNGCDFVLDQLENNKAYDDSLGIHFANIRLSPQFQLSWASYNTIQTIGWQIISNDSLRGKIIDLYDVYYGPLVDLATQWDYPYVQNQITPLYNREFNAADQTPLNYKDLVDDIETENIVREAQRFKGALIIWIDRRLERSNSLQIFIRKEIKRLES